VKLRVKACSDLHVDDTLQQNKVAQLDMWLAPAHQQKHAHVLQLAALPIHVLLLLLPGIEDPNFFFKTILAKPYAQNIIWGPHFYAQSVIPFALPKRFMEVRGSHNNIECTACACTFVLSTCCYATFIDSGGRLCAARTAKKTAECMLPAVLA
jgi:hypothetical protein